MPALRVSLMSGLLGLAFCACAVAAPKADQEAIKAHIVFLADDLLEGRATGSRGYDIAAAYVASQFSQHGLAPKGDKGTFLQPVPLRSTMLAPGSSFVELHTAGGVERLAEGSDYLVPAGGADDPSATALPMVFAGYGIRAERFKHDDYADLDVKGKIVVVLQGKPSRFPTEEGAHFGNGSEKRKLAAQLGALGVVTLWTPAAEKAYSFKAYREGLAFPNMNWIDAAGKPAHHLPGMQDGVVLSAEGARKLFASSGASVDAIFAAAAANQPMPRVDLKTSMTMGRKTVTHDLTSNNVVAMIEGSDPRLKHEYVVFSAHLDHIGQLEEKSGDNIYNGAMDNASGVAIMLETARLFSQPGARPRRSILFIALTGEEKGLLGSEYFAMNPTVPAGAMVANINLDMPLLTFDFKNVVAFGAQHSSLKHSTERALKSIGLGLIADPWPEQGLFTRSDHYSFVRQGVPSIFLATGMASFKKDEEAPKMWDEFLGKHYHKPSDDLSLPFNFEAAARFAQVNYSIGREIADAKNRPTWNKGNFFGDTFKP